jgi:hypothetical protein
MCPADRMSARFCASPTTVFTFLHAHMVYQPQPDACWEGSCPPKLRRHRVPPAAGAASGVPALTIVEKLALLPWRGFAADTVGGDGSPLDPVAKPAPLFMLGADGRSDSTPATMRDAPGAVVAAWLSTLSLHPLSKMGRECIEVQIQPIAGEHGEVGGNELLAQRVDKSIGSVLGPGS